MEIFEILDDAGEQNDLKQKIVTFLNQKKLTDKDKATLIEWGFRLVTYHKAGLKRPGRRTSRSCHPERSRGILALPFSLRSRKLEILRLAQDDRRNCRDVTTRLSFCIVMFSTATSPGRDKAYATAAPIS